MELPSGTAGRERAGRAAAAARSPAAVRGGVAGGEGVLINFGKFWHKLRVLAGLCPWRALSAPGVPQGAAAFPASPLPQSGRSLPGFPPAPISMENTC